jgi:hypothetical protein
MRFTLLAVLLCACSAASAQTTQPAAAADGWRPLFNGKDLAGWYPYLQGEPKGTDAKHVFTLEDGGVIHVHEDIASQATVGYLATDEEFGDYQLRFQYKWGGPRDGAKKGSPNSGLLYHVTGPDGARPGVVWPYCIQCQVKDGHTGEIVALGVSVATTIDPKKKDVPTYREDGDPLTTPAGPKAETKIAPPQRADAIDGWNDVEITVRGDTAEHRVNGKVVGRFTDAKSPVVTQPGTAGATPALMRLDRGRIGFQAEGYEILYRNVEIRPFTGEK